MRPNLLLMCKLLFALIVLHHFPDTLQEPFLPFIPGLDFLRTRSEWFTLFVQTVFFGAGFCLIINYRVRLAAIALGLVVIFVLLSSKPLFRNHIFIVGCLLLLSGLHRKNEDPWMLRLQMSIIYWGAFVNKILKVDWRSGQFMHNWLHEELRNPYYEFLFPLLPDQWFAVFLSWFVIVSEMVLAMLFLVRRWNNVGVGMAIAMHICFFVVVGRTIFGHFTEDILLAMLIFLHWPESVIQVRMKPSIHRATASFQALTNLDRQFLFSDAVIDRNHWLELRIDHRSMNNGAALWHFLKYNSVFYFSIFCVFNGLAYLLSRW